MPIPSEVSDLLAHVATERTRANAAKHLTPDGRAAVVARGAVGALHRALLAMRDLGADIVAAEAERDRRTAVARSAIPTPDAATLASAWPILRENASLRARALAAVNGDIGDDAQALYLVQAVAAAPLAELTGLDPETHRRASAALDAVAARSPDVVALDERVNDLEFALRQSASAVRGVLAELPADELAAAAFPPPPPANGAASSVHLLALAHRGPMFVDVTAAGGDKVYAALYGLHHAHHANAA